MKPGESCQKGRLIMHERDATSTQQQQTCTRQAACPKGCLFRPMGSVRRTKESASAVPRAGQSLVMSMMMASWCIPPHIWGTVMWTDLANMVGYPIQASTVRTPIYRVMATIKGHSSHVEYSGSLAPHRDPRPSPGLLRRIGGLWKAGAQPSRE